MNVTIDELTPDGWEIVPASDRSGRGWLNVGLDPRIWGTPHLHAPAHCVTHVLVKKQAES